MIHGVRPLFVDFRQAGIKGPPGPFVSASTSPALTGFVHGSRLPG